jgi:hypothetical protein
MLTRIKIQQQFGKVLVKRNLLWVGDKEQERGKAQIEMTERYRK